MREGDGGGLVQGDGPTLSRALAIFRKSSNIDEII